MWAGMNAIDTNGAVTDESKETTSNQREASERSLIISAVIVFLILWFFAVDVYFLIKENDAVTITEPTETTVSIENIPEVVAGVRMLTDEEFQQLESSLDLVIQKELTVTSIPAGKEGETGLDLSNGIFPGFGNVSVEEIPLD